MKGLDQLQARSGYDFHSDKSINVGKKQSFIVEKEAVDKNSLRSNTYPLLLQKTDFLVAIKTG
jgi:hypothetical protein